MSKDGNFQLTQNIRKSICQKLFVGKVRSMKDQVRQWIRDDHTERFILHVGTNNQNQDSASEIISKHFVDMANTLISEEKRVTISGNVLKIYEWNSKDEDVSRHPTDMCQTLNIVFYLQQHNKSILHLNEKGTLKIFLNCISFLFQTKDWRLRLKKIRQLVCPQISF